MKKILFIAIIAILVTGCSNEDPTTEITQPPTEKPVSPGEETVVAPLSDEIKTYFSLTGSNYVYEAVKLITETKGEKTVNGKKIDISQSSVENRDENAGTLSIKVSGTINGKAFSESYSLDGFAKKPENYHMASRAYARWKENVNKSPETSGIAFDEFYRLKKTDKFTAEYLSQWAEFCSSSPDGKNFYIFSEEDIANTQISEVQYNNGYISFIITYKGIKGKDSLKERPSLRFDKNEFYKHVVSPNIDNIKQYYMQGFFENLESFYGNAIKLSDDKVFLAELIPDSKSYNKDDNTIRCKLSLSALSDRNNELAQFDFDFSGFKPLSDLKKEWFVATSSDLNDYMTSRFTKAPDGDVTELVKKYPIAAWIKKTQMAVRRGSGSLLLYCSKSILNNVEVDTWIPESRRVIYSDIFLADPHFEVVSAQKTGNRMIITLAMTYVNEVSLQDVTAPLEVYL